MEKKNGKIIGKDFPFTTRELFEKIRLALSENGEMPEDLLDYHLATSETREIRDCEFDVKMDVHYGGNEGIYLCMYLEGNIGEVKAEKSCYGKYELGTFKTLVETKEALQKMSLLGANFIYAARSYVEENIDDFIWVGYRVAAYDDKGNYKAGYITPKVERVGELKKKLEEKYSSVKVTDLATRKEVEF